MSEENNVQMISSNTLLCRTCRFADKCHVVKMVNAHMEAAEQNAFEMMGVDLNLVPVVTYCPKYQKHPDIIRRQLENADTPGEDDDDEDYV